MADEDCEHLANEDRYSEERQRQELVCVACGRVHCWVTSEFLEGAINAREVWVDVKATTLRRLDYWRAKRAVVRSRRDTA